MVDQSVDASRLVEVPREECLRLLRDARLGRIAAAAPGWPPVIRPVGYVFDEPSQAVVFRSIEGSKLTRLLRSERAAFEIDGTDEEGGWSVIVVGPVDEITSAAELERLAGAWPTPALGGERMHVMRIRAAVVTGRRIVA